MNPQKDCAAQKRGEKVGYRCPPEATRFKKGQSGNPKGRPKGSLNVATLLAKALRERVVINENGNRKSVTKLEAALKQLINKAATGDIRALRHLFELLSESESKQNISAVQAPMGEADREVLQGILKRFQNEPRGGHENEEEPDGNDTERG